MARSRSNRNRTDSGRSSRTGILLGIAGAVVMMLLIYQVFLRSDDATPTSLGPVPESTSGADSTATTAPQEPTLPNGSFAELSLRDPFEAPTQFTPGGSSTTTTRPTTTTTSSSSFPTTPTTSPAQNPAPTTDVALLDVFTDAGGVQTARIRVGSVEYTAVSGQIFAVNYKLIAFTTCVGGQPGVSLTYADSPFSLCQGEQVTK
jgi:hypothetical protein